MICSNASFSEYIHSSQPFDNNSGETKVIEGDITPMIFWIIQDKAKS
jgi:hypothetical protein